MKKIVSLAAGLALVFGASNAAQAQSCTVAAAPGTCTVVHTVSATAPSILTLTLSSATTTLSNPVEADFDAPAGVTDIDVLNIEVKSNKAASATIHTAAGNWTGPYAKAIGDLSWSMNSGATWTPITGIGVTVVGSGKGNRNLNPLSWRTMWSLANDEPGAYTLPVTFTLVVP